jgi:hypothetical protein
MSLWLKQALPEQRHTKRFSILMRADMSNYAILCDGLKMGNTREHIEQPLDN